MKKLFILALAAMFCMAGFAKSTQEVINEITKSTGAQAITLSKDLIAAQAAAMPENVKALLSNLDGGTLVLLSEGTDEQIKTFNDRVGEIDSEAYEAMASFVDESDTKKYSASVRATMLPNFSSPFRMMKIVPLSTLPAR